MHPSSTWIRILSALCTFVLVVRSAPVAGPLPAPAREHEHHHLTDNDNGALLLRGPESLMDDGSDIFEREDDSLETRGRLRMLAPAVKWALNKIPKGHSFKTPAAKYTGQEVNAAAKAALKQAQAGVKQNGYPKPGSGFSKAESKADPTKRTGVSYHAPLIKKGSKGKTAGPSPGPDRVIVHQKPGKTRFDVHVSYHDGKKRVPVGTGAKSHPMSAGKRKTSGGQKQAKGRRRK